MVHTETFDEPYTEEMGGETLVTWLLDESNEATTLTATTLYKSSDDRDRVLQSGFDEGAAETFDLLAELLENMQSGQD
jgi:uncharacterized protein YndB with AHSA1/START domain